MSEFDSPPPPPPPPPPPAAKQPRPSKRGGGGFNEHIAAASGSRTASGESAAQAADAAAAVPLAALEDRSPLGCGLGNQGATCYLNSLLQSLFWTPEFRRFVYQNGSGHPMTEELQRLFARMQVGARPFADTRALTASFGWGETDGFEQQDVQELMRVLFDAIEQVAGTALTALYRGTFRDSMRCDACGAERARLDPFLDVQLLTRGVASVEEGLARFVEPEALRVSEGNGLRCEQCGDGAPVDFTKATRFLELPRILTLQLKRFDYDPRTFRRVKVNGRVTFPLVLDMAPFLDEGAGAGAGDPVLYDLFSVLLHSGGALGGHYQAFVKDVEKGTWLRVNDATVIAASEAELAQGFGGSAQQQQQQTTTPATTERKKWNAESTTSAYMLVYRRRTPEALEDARQVPADDIPAHIRAEIEADNAKFAQDREAYRIKRETLVLRVHYGDPTIPGAFSVPVHRSVPLADALRTICDAVRAAEPDVPSDMSLVRLRRLNTQTRMPCEAYTDLEKPIGQIGFHSEMPLLLETRSEGAAFPVIDDGIRLLAARIDSSTGAFTTPAPIAVSADAVARDLRAPIANALSLDPDKLRVVRITLGADGSHQDSAVVLELDDKRIKADLGLADGMVLYGEEASDAPSPLLERFEREANAIDICFNPVGSREYSEHVTVDQRRTLRDLKDLVAETLGLQRDSFRLCNNLFSKRDFADLTKTLLQAGLFDGSNVAVIPGQPPSAGEVRITAFLYSAEADGGLLGAARFNKIAEFSIKEEASVGELAAMVASSPELLDLRQPGSAEPSAGSLRIRLKVGPRAAHMLDHRRSLRDCLPGLRVGKEVAVQLLSKPDPVFPSGRALIVEIQLFDSEKGELDPRKVEVALDSEAVLSELKLRAREAFSIDPAEDVFAAKPPRFLQEPEQLRELNWYADGDIQLREMPLNAVDGDLMLVSKTMPVSSRTSSRNGGKERALRIDVFPVPPRQ